MRMSVDERALQSRFPHLYAQQRDRRRASRRAGRLTPRMLVAVLLSVVGWAGTFALFLWQARIEMHLRWVTRFAPW